MGPRGATLRLLGSPHCVLVKTASRFVDPVVSYVPFWSLSPSLCTSIYVSHPPLLSFASWTSFRICSLSSLLRSPDTLILLKQGSALRFPSMLILAAFPYCCIGKPSEPLMSSSISLFFSRRATSMISVQRSKMSKLVYWQIPHHASRLRVHFLPFPHCG